MTEPNNPHQDILDSFRQMIRDKYSIVDDAVFFIENNVSLSGINTGITNQRDVLSHYCSLLNEPTMSRDKALHHLGEAEGHLRRALVDTYSQAVSMLAQQVVEVTNSYKKIVLPLLPDDRLPSVPDLQNINSMWKEIRELRKESRQAKSQNSWEGAEASAKYSLQTFKKLEGMKEQFECHIPVANQIRENRRNRVIQYWAIAATLIALILAILQLWS